jgi:hypothetical protein
MREKVFTSRIDQVSGLWTSGNMLNLPRCIARARLSSSRLYLSRVGLRYFKFESVLLIVTNTESETTLQYAFDQSVSPNGGTVRILVVVEPEWTDIDCQPRGSIHTFSLCIMSTCGRNL